MNDTRSIRLGVGLLVLAVALVFVWLGARAVVGVLVDALWFEAVGYPSVFRTLLRMRLVLGGGAFLVSAAVMLANIALAYRWARLQEHSVLHQLEADPRRLDVAARRLLYAAALFSALLIGASVAQHWAEFAAYYYATPFDVQEPVFDLDLSFYIFRLPAAAYLFKVLLSVAILSAAFSLAAYFLRGAIRFDSPGHALSGAPFRHVSALAGIAFVLFSVRFEVARFQLLESRRGSVFGAGYTDIHAAAPAYDILFWLTLALAAWFLFNAIRQIRPGNLYALGGYVVLWIALELAWPWMIQGFVVRPNEWAREEEYIKRNIAFTRRAYGLDRVTEKAWEGTGVLDEEVLAAHAGTTDNLLLWDSVRMRDVLNQKQRIRSYYEFSDVDFDRYVIDGAPRPVAVSVRELAPGYLPETSRVWTNLHLQYTHGYGFCMGYANSATAEGLPDLLISNIPPEAAPGLPVEQPRIYYGERTYGYALTHTSMDEFDYPGDPENFFNRYDGSGGIPVGSLGRRILFSLHTGDKDILFTNQFTDEARILVFRQVRQRVSRLAPFLSWDENPYPVLHDGRIVWVLDGYTTTHRYPYSDPVAKTNYLRNAVKATVDAYDGTVTFYTADEEDPILQVYRQVFPELLRPLDEMPADLRAHLRYPNDLFRVQTVIYRRYHVDDAKVFFNGEDVWTFPRDADGSEGGSGEEPRYVVMEMPGADRGPEFMITRTFTVEGKDNMIGWMAGGCDGDRLGELTLFRLPKRLNIYGPNQAKGRFNQDPAVSEFMTLMGQLGSVVSGTRVLAVPVRDGLLYIQSLFIEDPTIRIPELKRVIVGHGDRVAMAPTREEALTRLFRRVTGSDPSAVDAEAAAPPVAEEVAAEAYVSEERAPGESTLESARALYERARERLRAGDWAGFGAAFDELEALLPAEE